MDETPPHTFEPTQPAAVSPWRVRLLAATIFGSVAFLLGGGLGTWMRSQEVIFGVVAASVVVALAAGPRVHRRVVATGKAGDGAIYGAFLFPIAYTLCAIVFLLSSPHDASSQNLEIVAILGLGLVPFWMIFGAMAGWAFGFLAVRGNRSPPRPNLK